MNSQGLWEAGFAVSRGQCDPGSHRRIRLVCLNNSTAGRELKPATQGYAEAATVPLGKESCLARRPYPPQQSGEGNLWLGQMRPSQFHHTSGQHIVAGP